MSPLKSSIFLSCSLFLSSPTLLCAQSAAKVTTAEVVFDQVVEQVGLTGTITAERRASLSSRTSGLVAKVHVDAGDHVEVDQVLMELDPALTKVAVERAHSAHREAEYRLKETKRLADEGRELARTRALPQTEADARIAEVAIAEAAVAQTAANLQEQKELLARHQLPAPFAGVISQKMTEMGEWVETGTVVLELVEVDHVRLDVRAPQEWLQRIPNEGQVVVHLNDAPDSPLTASIRKKVMVPDPVSRTFLIRLDVDDPQGRLAPGMSASATFSVPSDRKTLVLPRDAIVRLPSGMVQVWRVEDENGAPIARPRNVRIGSSTGQLVQILDGIEAGDQVVVKGNETLRPEQPLEILPSESPAPPAS